MYIRKSSLIITILIFLLLIEGGIIIASKYFNVTTLSKYRIISQNEFRQETSRTEFGFSEEYRKYFTQKLKEKFSLKESYNYTLEEAREVREKLLNISVRDYQREKVKEYNDPIILLDNLINGKYLLCGETAKLYAYVLHSLGFKVRIMTVTRSIFDSWDKHSFVEFWDELRKKWIISDPTFNISLKADSNYLSSDELFDLIHIGKFDAIQVEHGRKTIYEIPIEKFYISYYSLFNNLYFVQYYNKIEISEFPPIRWFDKRFDKLVVQTNRFPIRDNSILIQNFMMFFVLLFNPTLIIILSLILLIYKFIPKKFFNENKHVFYETIPSIFRIRRNM